MLVIKDSTYPLLRALETLGEKEIVVAFTYLEKMFADLFVLLSDPANNFSLNQSNGEWRLIIDEPSTKPVQPSVSSVVGVIDILQELFGVIAKFLFEDNVNFIARWGALVWTSLVTGIC